MHSWQDIKNNKQIDSIEDPVLSFELGKEEFEEQYELILAKLNCDKDEYGKIIKEHTIEYYFDIHPLRKNVLIFKDEDKKWEFYDIGLKQKSVTDLTKIYHGTQNNEEIDYGCKKVTFYESASSSERSSESSNENIIN